jgi:hypothetical protein
MRLHKLLAYQISHAYQKPVRQAYRDFVPLNNLVYSEPLKIPYASQGAKM